MLSAVGPHFKFDGSKDTICTPSSPFRAHGGCRPRRSSLDSPYRRRSWREKRRRQSPLTKAHSLPTLRDDSARGERANTGRCPPPRPHSPRVGGPSSHQKPFFQSLLGAGPRVCACACVCALGRGLPRAGQPSCLLHAVSCSARASWRRGRRSHSARAADRGRRAWGSARPPLPVVRLARTR